MSRDPRVEHLQRLHRQRRLRAAGQSRSPGRLLLMLVLMSMILGVLVTLAGQEEVGAWVRHVSSSLQVERVGMLPPADAR
jgi:hypothetical protein